MKDKKEYFDQLTSSPDFHYGSYLNHTSSNVSPPSNPYENDNSNMMVIHNYDNSNFMEDEFSKTHSINFSGTVKEGNTYPNATTLNSENIETKGTGTNQNLSEYQQQILSNNSNNMNETDWNNFKTDETKDENPDIQLHECNFQLTEDGSYLDRIQESDQKKNDEYFKSNEDSPSCDNPIDNLDNFLKKKTQAQRVTQEKFQREQDQLLRLSSQRLKDNYASFGNTNKDDDVIGDPSQLPKSYD